jgi:hypothetical protein
MDLDSMYSKILALQPSQQAHPVTLNNSFRMACLQIPEMRDSFRMDYLKIVRTESDWEIDDVMHDCGTCRVVEPSSLSPNGSMQHRLFRELCTEHDYILKINGHGKDPHHHVRLSPIADGYLATFWGAEIPQGFIFEWVIDTATVAKYAANCPGFFSVIAELIMRYLEAVGVVHGRDLHKSPTPTLHSAPRYLG